jgi:hypothetical protein
MARLCRILIAATLTVHLTVGCCWHHAHGCEGNSSLSSTHSDAPHDDQCPESSGDHSQHGTEDCQGAKCSFVSPNRTINDSLVQPLPAFSAELLDDQLPLVGIGREQHVLSSGRLLLPVRLHLANQVLLI